MNAADYKEKGREAYRRGRVIIAGAIAPRFWQRRAFMAGYAEARDAWRAANPGTDELAASRDRNAAWCKAARAAIVERAP